MCVLVWLDLFTQTTPFAGLSHLPALTFSALKLAFYKGLLVGLTELFRFLG